MEGNILVWQYGAFDGNSIPWGDYRQRALIDTAVLLALAVLPHLLFRSASPARIGTAAWFLVLLQLIGGTVRLDGKLLTDTVTGAADDSVYAFAPRNNTVLILLDEFQGPAFQEILNRAPEYGEFFRDFTFYRNTTGSFPTTNPSVPAILTGIPYQPPGSLREFFAATLGTESLPRAFAAAGWQSAIVTLPQLCPLIGVSPCTSLGEIAIRDPYLRRRQYILQLLDLTLFRFAPHLLKPHVYNDEAWLLQQQDAEPKAAPHQLMSLRLVDRLEQTAVLDPSLSGSFKFFHLLIPHTPYQRDAECGMLPPVRRGKGENYLLHAQCGLRLARRIIERIRTLGVYEDATIIVLADHGSPANRRHVDPPPSGTRGGNPPGTRKILRALPLLLVKGPGERHERIQTSGAPVQLIDVARTATSLAGIPSKLPGRPVHEVAEDDPIVRRYSYYAWKNAFWQKDELPPLEHFTVRGQAWDLRNWTAEP